MDKMEKLKNIITYILKNYPHKKDLSNARVTKMVYLADWRSAITRKRLLTTGVDWYFDNFGPFVWDVKDCVDANPSVFDAKDFTSGGAFGDRRILFSLKNYDAEPEITAEEKAILDHIMENTKDLDWSRFIRLIYSTYPILTSERYSHLDLVAKATEYTAKDM